MIRDVVPRIMNDSERFLAVFTLLELYTMPFEIQQGQFKLIEAMAGAMNEARAFDVLKNNGVTRILKAFNYHSPTFQPTVTLFLTRVVEHGRKYLDIPTLISMTLCPYPTVQDVGMRTLAKLSDSAAEGGKSLDAEFENHVPFLLEALKSAKNSSDFKNHALQTLSNLSVRDYLRPIIIDHRGVGAFLAAVRDPSNVEGQRIGAKGLVNLSSGRRDLRLQLVAELSEEIKALYRNELDPILGAYVQTMIHPHGK